MTKADIVAEIAAATGVEKAEVMTVVEAFMSTVKKAMIEGNNVYLRGFGSFILKKRAEKVARNITAGTSVVVPAHTIPAFKPNRDFVDKVRGKKR